MTEYEFTRETLQSLRDLESQVADTEEKILVGHYETIQRLNVPVGLFDIRASNFVPRDTIYMMSPEQFGELQRAGDDLCANQEKRRLIDSQGA